LAYTLATVTAFAIFKIVSEYQTGRVEKPENFQAFEGLAKQNPLLAFCLSVSLLSLAGIPLTGGFWGKFFVFADTFHRNITYSIIVAILMSAVGIYYYFKGIIAAYFKSSELETIHIPALYKIALVLSTLGTLVLGLYPTIVKTLF
jgi:NADH-quinone oxidoreductase subunit N